MTGIHRRTLLRGIGASAATTSIASLAGCSGGSAEAESDGSGGSAEETSAAETTSAPEQSDGESDAGADSDSDSESDSDSGSGSSGGVPGEVKEWLSDVKNYDGVVDETGSGSVSVTVGAKGNGGNFAFDPPAIRVSAGTKVTWEWNGKGGAHNVVDDGGSFESEMTSESGHTFSHTFEEAGAYLYYCQPHKTLGMKGAIVVE